MYSVIINKKEELDGALDKIMTEFEKLPDTMWEIVIRKPIRTSRQNSAMHKFYEIIAETLNEAGEPFDRDFFREGWEQDWNGTMIKELLWRPIQEARFKKHSTTEITTQELSEVAEILRLGLLSKGIEIKFPNIYDLLNNK